VKIKICDELDKRVFSIVVESDSYDNVHKNNVIQYCDILSSNEKKIMNTRLIMKLLIRRNSMRVIRFSATNNSKKTIYQLFSNLRYDELYEVVVNKFFYQTTIVYRFKLERLSN